MDDVKLKAALMAAEKQIKKILYPPKPPTPIESILGEWYRSKKNHIYKWQLVALENQHDR